MDDTWRTILIIVLVIAVSLLIDWWRSRGRGMTIDPAAVSESEAMYTGPEALAWFAENKNESAFASNRFGATEKAVAFVRTLYDAGATEVLISKQCIMDEEWRIAEEKGPYADGMVVVFPDDPEKRKALRAICETEINAEGFDWQPDELAERGRVFLWWD